MGRDELLRLDEHAARTAAGVIHLAVVGVEHRHQGFHDTGRGIELPTLLAFGQGELAEEVFVYLTEQVASLAGVIAKANS
ncbi:hypothetical protein D3C80_1884210 [compost metagenome]